MTELRITCTECKATKIIKVHQADIVKYNQGELIQRAFPYLSAGDRELMISRVCSDCFDIMFAPSLSVE